MDRLKISEDSHGFYITLSNPQKKNAIDEKMIQEFIEFFSDEAKFIQKNFVLIEGEGDVFCSGGDLYWMIEKGRTTYDINLKDALNVAQMFLSIWECPAPVVLKLHGGAYGGGVGLAAVSDLVIAQRDAKISLPEVKMGFIPAVISVFIIRKIGIAHFLKLSLTAKEVSAEEAEKVGLVSYAVPKEQLENKKYEVLQELIKSPPEALATTKKMARNITSMDIEFAIRYMAEQLAYIRADEKVRNRIKLFFERKTQGNQKNRF